MLFDDVFNQFFVYVSDDYILINLYLIFVNVYMYL
jgi:hypothetical protein